MRLAFALLVLCTAASRTAFADEPATNVTAAGRAADSVDTVLLRDGESLRGAIISSTQTAITLRLRSGEEKTIALGEVKMMSGTDVPHAALSAATGPELVAAPPAPTRWYGWQTLSSDGGALLLAVLSAEASAQASQSGSGQGVSTVLGVTSGLVYALGPAMIHGFGHGNPGRGAASIGLRLGAPVLLGVVGGLLGVPAQNHCESANRGDDFCLNEAADAALGVIAGIATAIVLDAAVLAREPAPEDPRRLSLVPLIVPKGSASQPRGAGGLALAARF